MSSFWALVRRNAPWRPITVWLLHSGVTTSVLFGFLAWVRASGSSTTDPVGATLAVCWVGVLPYLLLGRVRTRCSELDLSLPLSARRLWLAHLVAVVLGAWSLVVLALAVVGIHLWWLPRPGPVPLGTSDMWALGGQLLAGFALATAVIEAFDLQAQQIRTTLTDVTRRLLVVAGVVALSLAAKGHRWIVVTGLAVLATLVAGWSWRRLPLVFRLLPRTPEVDRGTATRGDAPWTSGSRARRPAVLLTVHGPRWGPIAAWLTLPWVVLAGILASGLLSLWADLEDLRFMYIPFYVYIVLTPVFTGVPQLTYFDPLPISRRRLFALLGLPPLLLFAAGYGVGQLGILRWQDRPELVQLAPSRLNERWALFVPASRLEITWNGEVPVISSPWGEEHPAWSAPVLPGLAPRLYSPFHSSDASTEAFMALQISRAVEAVYGASVPPSTIRSRYLEVHEGVVRPRHEKLTLRGDFPDLAPRGSGPVFPVLFFSTAVPALLMAALFLAAYRPGWTDRGRKAIWLAILAVTMGSLIGFFALTVAGAVTPWVLRGFCEVLIRSLGQLPGGRLLAWVGSLLPTAFAYRLAERGLQRAELPPRAMAWRPGLL